MKQWTKILASLFLLSCGSSLACTFSLKAEKVISLSGPMTVLIQRLGLLTEKKLQGISIFNPVRQKDFSGKVYPGGIFLSPSTDADFKNALVFIDESRELQNNFSSRSDVRLVSINSRGLLPLEVIEMTWKVFAPFTKGCENQYQVLFEEARKNQRELLSLISGLPPVVYFLGEIKGDKLPELVVANDGVVKLIKENPRVKTYPSELAYVSWSAKILNSLPGATYVGLEDTGASGKSEIKHSSRGINVYYPGILVPGFTQLEGFLFWLKHR